MHTDMDKLRGDTWACGDTRTRVGTDVREPVYTEYAHACPQTRMWGCTHRCTYSYVRGHTHTERPARASICNSSPKLYALSIPPPSPGLPLLTFHLQYLKHQGQHSLKGNTPILSFYTLKKPYFTLPGCSFGQMLLQRKTDGGPSRFLSSCPHHLAPQIHLPAVKDTVAS